MDNRNANPLSNPRLATEVSEEPRRMDSERRIVTEISEEPRRADVGVRVATEVSEEPRRNQTNRRVPTEVSEEPRRNPIAVNVRIPTETSEEPRRSDVSGRVPTEVSEEPRRADDGGILDERMSRVIEHVHSAPITSIEQFLDDIKTLKSLKGVDGSEYTVKGLLPVQGGDSIVILCADEDGHDVVAKVFFNAESGKGTSLKARRMVFDFMQSPEGQKAVLPVVDYGVVEVIDGYSNYFEVFPYCKGGDLANKGPMSFEELVDIVSQLNEAIHAIHNAGIIHRDIKPENLYRLNGRIVIGDFGIARVAAQGVTYTTAGTDGYRAPESVLAPTAGKSAYIFETPSDYYSLGVTLACLYEGKYIYEGKDPGVIASAYHESHLPLAYRDDPHQAELENLLDGLVQYDAKRRFGYEDVNRWLEDHSYAVKRTESGWPRSYLFMDDSCPNEESLFSSITRDSSCWNEARDQLYSKYFENFFKSFQPKLARKAQRVDESFRDSDPDLGLVHFLKELYAPGAIVWRGYKWNSLSELAEKMMGTNTPSQYGEILQKKIITHWVENTIGIECSEENRRIITSIEDLAQENPELACYWFGFSFAQMKKMEINSVIVSDVSSLFKQLFGSAGYFYNAGAYERLIDLSEGAKLYGFLYSFGCKDLIENAFSIAESYSENAKFPIFLELFDEIGQKAGVSVDIVRNFCLNYGPIGMARYVQSLTKEKKDIYSGRTSHGSAIIKKIEGFVLPTTSSVSDMFSKYKPLLAAVDELKSQMEENPFAALAGVYSGDVAIVCTNLKGYFAYRIMGRLVPLGFKTFIESN